MAELFESHEPLALESGSELPGFTLAFTTQGKLNAAQDNVVWITHALTADADVSAWWSGLVGEGRLFDPAKDFIVCANVLGSCYGSTGPLSVNPATGEPWFHSFPLLTIRDIVAALDRLRQHLGISRIGTLVGGSLGGQQALEWAIAQPQIVQRLALIATNARHSAWGIAWNESQRLAIEADPSFAERRADAGAAGLKAARSVALLSYRHAGTYNSAQLDRDEKLRDFRAASYQQHQGDKLVRRFNAFSYVALSRAMDSHHVGRGRGGVEAALAKVQAKTLVIGIESDGLFPLDEQRLLAAHIPHAAFASIPSHYGHDGFLLETDALTAILKPFLEKEGGETVEELLLEAREA
jgi:homoserine O-acetyltransferase